MLRKVKKDQNLALFAISLDRETARFREIMTQITNAEPIENYDSHLKFLQAYSKKLLQPCYLEFAQSTSCFGTKEIVYNLYECVILTYAMIFKREFNDISRINPQVFFPDVLYFLRATQSFSFQFDVYLDALSVTAYCTHQYAEPSVRLESFELAKVLFSEGMKNLPDDHGRKLVFFGNMFEVYVKMYSFIQNEDFLKKAYTLLKMIKEHKILFNARSSHFAIKIISESEKPNFELLAYFLKNLQSEELCRETLSQIDLSFSKLLNYLPNFDKSTFKTIMVIVDRRLNAEMPPDWQMFLGFVNHYKHLLSGKHQQQVYEYARRLTSEMSSFSMEQKRGCTQDLFAILSSFPKSNLAKIRALYTQLSEKNSEIIDEELRAHFFNLLAKAQGYTFDDFEFLFQQLPQENPEKINVILANLFENYSSMEPEFVEFCRRFWVIIQADKYLYNLFLNHFDVTAFQLEQSERVQQEFEANRILQEHIVLLGQEFSCSSIDVKIIQAFLKYLENLNHNRVSQRLLPQEKLNHLQQTKEQLDRFLLLISQSKSLNIRIKRYQTRLIEILTCPHCDFDLTQLIQEYEQHIAHTELSLRENEERSSRVQIDITKAWTILEQGDIEAIEHLHRTINLTEDTPIKLYLLKIKCLIKLGYYDQALIWLPKILIRCPEEHKKTLELSWARCCEALGQYQDALDVYKSIFLREKSNQRFQTSMNMAYCYEKLGKPGDLQRALQIYKQLLKNAPEEFTVQKAIAMCLISQGKYAEAKNTIHQIPGWETNAKIQALLGSLHLSQSNYIEAIQCYQRALCTEQSNLKWVKALLSCYFFDTANVNQADKERLIQFILQSEKNDLETLQAKVWVYIQIRRYKNALDILDVIAHRFGQTQFTYVKRAICQRGLDRVKDATHGLLMFRRYQESPLILKHLAISCMQLNAGKEALECFDFLVEEYPSFSLAYSKAIDYAIRLQDGDRVMRYWKLFNTYCSEHENLKAMLSDRVERYQANQLTEEYETCFHEHCDEEALLDVEHQTYAALDAIDITGGPDFVSQASHATLFGQENTHATATQASGVHAYAPT